MKIHVDDKSGASSKPGKTYLIPEKAKSSVIAKARRHAERQAASVISL